MGSFFWRESGRMLLLPEEYVLLSILKSLYGLFLEGACRPIIGLQGVWKVFVCLLSVLWFTEYSPTVFSLWGTCEKMVNITLRTSSLISRGCNVVLLRLLRLRSVEPFSWTHIKESCWCNDQPILNTYRSSQLFRNNIFLRL